jgi:phosphate transport system substrate-binding protein
MTRLHSPASLLVAALLALAGTTTAMARDDIRMVGSALVLEFAQPAAKRFATQSGRPTPSVEITGSGVGFGMFCAGVGYEHPDLNASSRRITAAELAECRRNGVAEITEIEIGIEGLAVVSGKQGDDFALSRAQLFNALAREVEVDGALVENPHSSWRDIDAGLPDLPIRVMGPSPDSAALHGFLEMVMAGPCLEYPAFRALDEAERYRACRNLRRDGRYERVSRTRPRCSTGCATTTRPSRWSASRCCSAIART